MIASCSGEAGEEEEGEEGVIANFLWHGADPHQRTERAGETALHLAARYARSDAAKRLLESGADANAQDHAGRTPLHAAVAADAQGVFQVFRKIYSLGSEWKKRETYICTTGYYKSHM